MFCLQENMLGATFLLKKKEPYAGEFELEFFWKSSSFSLIFKGDIATCTQHSRILKKC